jgi:YbgC/YbaW family acyl-CoA thioester hydrolase
MSGDLRIPANSAPGAEIMRTFDDTLRVRSYELDALGHVNHAVYLNYLEQARYDAMAAGGFPHSEVLGRGWGIYVVRLEVEYKKECFQGDVLRIRTWVEEFRKVSMTIGHEIRRVAEGEGAEPALTARVVLVWIGEDGRPMRVPEGARTSLGG